MNILVIALSGIGDAIMFTPTLDKLKVEFPNANIDVLVMFKGVKDIFEKLPQITKVHYMDFLNGSKFQSLKFVLQIRKKYDISINVYPSNRKEYNLISWLIGAKYRLAAEYIRMDFANLGFLNNVRIREDDNVHNVVTNFRLVEKLSNNQKIEIPPLKIILSEDDLNFANNFLKEQNISESELVIGFHMGTAILKNHINRRWAPEKFAKLAELLINNFNAKILLFGASDEQKLKNTVINHVSKNAISVDAKRLTNSAAVMNRCNLFVTNDSGLMHIAAALQLNTLAIIGPTNKSYISPWHTNHKIASLNLECSPCFFYSPKPLACVAAEQKHSTDPNDYFRCIKELSVDFVYSKAIEMLNK